MVISYYTIQFFDFGEAHPVRFAKNTDFWQQARKVKVKPSGSAVALKDDLRRRSDFLSSLF